MTLGNTIESPARALLERAVSEMTKKIAGINLSSALFSKTGTPDWGSFIVRTVGDYEAVLILSADKEFFYEIARVMKKNNDVSIKDVVVYVTEYYNILCGYFISHLNSRLHFKARFGIPEFWKGQISPPNPGTGCTACLQYTSLYGNLQISGYGLPTK